MAELENTKKKSKGPIRFEAIVPFGIVVLLVIIYFKLFFDLHLRKGIEIAGYYANGAQVDVADVTTSFWNMSFELTGLQVTDPQKPTKNRIEIERIYARLLWDALLRFKFVVEDSGITGIQTWSNRKSPGRLKPVDPESQGVKERGLEAAKEEFQGTALGDVANVAGGADVGGTLSGLEDQLKSKAYIEQLSSELKAKEKEWKAKIDALPQGPEIENLKARIKNVKINTSNFNELQKSLKEVDALAKEAGAKIGNTNNILSDLKNDLDKYSKAMQKVDELIKQDQAMLRSRLNVPNLDAKDLARHLFGPQFTSKLAQIEKYMRMSRKYAPPKKSPEQRQAEMAEQLKPPPRGEGTNYQFGRPNSYPLFWLKRTTISSKAGRGLNGNMDGYIADVTTDPPIVGRPMVLDVKGDFPEQHITGVQLKVIVDHVTHIPKETVFMTVGGYPVEGQMLSDSEDVKLGFNKGSAGSKLTIQLVEENVDIALNNNLTKIDYIVSAKNEHLDGLLKGAVADIPHVTLDAAANGTWTDLRMDIRSNLGSELSRAFQKQIQAKVDEAKKKIDDYMEKEVGPKKRELTEKFDEFKSKYLGQAEKKKEEVTQVQKQAENKAKDTQNSGKKGAEDKAKKELEKVFKGIKF